MWSGAMCNKSVVTVLYCTVIRIELIRNDSWSKWRVRPPGSLWIDHCLITWRAHGDAPPQNGPTVLPLLERFIIWRWASDLIVIQDQHRKKTNQTLTSKPGQLRLNITSTVGGRGGKNTRNATQKSSSHPGSSQQELSCCEVMYC